jgi:hypothetical protein
MLVSLLPVLLMLLLLPSTVQQQQQQQQQQQLKLGVMVYRPQSLPESMFEVRPSDTLLLSC